MRLLARRQVDRHLLYLKDYGALSKAVAGDAAEGVRALHRVKLPYFFRERRGDEVWRDVNLTEITQGGLDGELRGGGDVGEVDGVGRFERGGLCGKEVERGWEGLLLLLLLLSMSLV